MNVNSTLLTALSPIAPTYPDFYSGDANEYITFNYADERPALYANNTDLYDETTVQVHYFTKGNPHTNKKAIRKALRDADFSIISTEQFSEIGTDGKIQYTHVIVNAWIEATIND